MVDCVLDKHPKCVKAQCNNTGTLVAEVAPECP